MPGFPDGMAGAAPGPSPARDGSTHSRPCQTSSGFRAAGQLDGQSHWLMQGQEHPCKRIASHVLVRPLAVPGRERIRFVLAHIPICTEAPGPRNSVPRGGDRSRHLRRPSGRMLLGLPMPRSARVSQRCKPRHGPSLRVLLVCWRPLAAERHLRPRGPSVPNEPLTSRSIRRASRVSGPGTGGRSPVAVANGARRNCRDSTTLQFPSSPQSVTTEC